MTQTIFPNAPEHSTYDVVIIGGAIMGSSAAWFLSQNPDFDGNILVVEKDPTYEFSSTMATNSCMRQQFSAGLNIQISQFAAEFVQNMRSFMGDDPDVPELKIHNFGYMYLADTDDFADVLRENLAVQKQYGAKTKIMTPDEIITDYPFYNVDDIVLGSLNTHNEGYWEGITVFDWWRKKARQNGVEYIQNEVVSMAKNQSGSKIETIKLKSGEIISCGNIINASGPRAIETTRMAGFDLPVEPRKRYTWVFSAENPLDRDLPLTIDPSGVHFRQDGTSLYMAGGHNEIDPAVAYDDFEMDHNLWVDHIWPVLATRIPQFEAIKVVREWAGHYAYNAFDHNAILGPHTEVDNFFFLNGFSGHGLQQSPAMGRGTSELITYGEYKTLDLTPFHFERIVKDTPLIEKAVI